MDPDDEETLLKSYEETGKNLKHLVVHNSLITFIVFTLVAVAFLLMALFIRFPQNGSTDLDAPWAVGNTVLSIFSGAFFIAGLAIYITNLVRYHFIDLAEIGKKETERLEKQNRSEQEKEEDKLKEKIREIDPSANLEDRVTDDELDEYGNIKENKEN